jgi:hypothetical protein
MIAISFVLAVFAAPQAPPENALLAGSFHGVDFGNSVDAVTARLSEHCSELVRVDLPVPTNPLAREKQTHLVCRDLATSDGFTIDEVAFTFGDDALGLVEARGGACVALLGSLEEEPFELLDYLAFLRASLVVDEADDAAWILGAEALHAHLFLRSNPDLPSAPERSAPFERSAARPKAFEFGLSIDELRKVMTAASVPTDVQKIDAPWLATKPRSQVQVNCYGVEYAGFARKVEAVFGDGTLQLLWILTATGEEDRVRQALVRAYGPPEFVSKEVEAFDGWRVALRKDKPEVLMIADELVPHYRAQFGGDGE